MVTKEDLEAIADHLAPRLDTYEFAIYFYLLRHSCMQDKPDVVVGLKSARRRMALGIGEKGKPMAETTCYEKLRSLQGKSCIEILDTTREGHRIRVKLPSEIPGVIPDPSSLAAPVVEEMDFFNVEENRRAILKREGHRCFYCLRKLDKGNYVIEHVASRPAGSNSYRNVVAACRGCNNRKNDRPVEDFLREIYREKLLSEEDFQGRVTALEKLAAGELKPEI